MLYKALSFPTHFPDAGITSSVRAGYYYEYSLSMICPNHDIDPTILAIPLLNFTYHIKYACSLRRFLHRRFVYLLLLFVGERKDPVTQHQDGGEFDVDCLRQ